MKIVILFLLLLLAFITGYFLAEPDIVVVERYRVLVVEKVIENNTETRIETIRYVGATEDELERAFDAIAYGRRSHQVMVDYPHFQNVTYTGNTTFNQMWVENYDLFYLLLARAYE